MTQNSANTSQLKNKTKEKFVKSSGVKIEMKISRNSRWKQFTSRSDMIYNMFQNEQNEIVFQVTDMVDFFEEKLSENEFVQRFQTLNPAVEADPSIIDVVAKELSDQAIVKQQDEGTVVALSFLECDIMLTWEFRPEKLPSSKLHENVTKLILKTLNCLAFTNVSKETRF